MLAVGVVAVLVFVGLAGWKARAKHLAESTRKLLAAKRVNLEEDLRLWESEEKTARASLAESKGLPDTRAAATSVPVAETPPPSPAISYAEWMKDPNVQLLALAHARAELAVGYGPFFRAKNLSAARVEHLRDALTRYKAFNDDISAVAGEKDLRSSDQAIRAQREAATAELRAAVTEVLGPGGYEDLKNYQRALPVRTFVGKIAGAATLAGLPMSVQQVETLTDFIAQTDPEYVAGGRANLQRVDWKQTEAQARAILAPEQMKFFQTSPIGSANRQLKEELSKTGFRALHEMAPQLEQISR